MKESLNYFAWPAIAGLLAALLILDRWVLPSGDGSNGALRAPVSYARAVSAASPAVVNIYTAKVVRERYNPLLNDSLTRRLAQRTPRQRIERSLGSG